MISTKPHYRLTDKRPSYYYIKKNRAIICPTLRAASSSMSKALSGRPTVSPARAIELRSQGVDAVMWIRDPLERMACAFHIFGTNRGWDINHFIDERLKQEYNRHWVPQTTVHCLDGRLVPSIVYPFELINETWPKFARGYTLMHTKKSPGRKTWDDLQQELSDDRIEKVINFYGGDLSLRISVCLKYGIDI